MYVHGYAASIGQVMGSTYRKKGWEVCAEILLRMS